MRILNLDLRYRAALLNCAVFAAIGLTGLRAWAQQPSPVLSPGIVTTFAPIAEKVDPSVVSVHTSKTVRIPHMLREFFNAPGSETTQGLGSGVIVSSDGYILTNNHVAEGADEILVTLGQDRKEYKAKRIGSDPGTDIAVLKIEEKNLPVITFADSDKVRVGDVVLAVGNPFGLTQTVTMGIISGLGRGGMGMTDYENFIQTDASINPGNSGGALVDMAGRLVGINTAIFSRSGGNQGIGFAVPSNLAAAVLKSIREKGRVVRGYLGTVIQPVTGDLAGAFGLKELTGALVSDVAADSPAGKAGIQHGDVITTVDGKKVEGPRELRLMIAGMAPGTQVDLKIVRDGKEKDVRVELGELPQTGPSAAEPSPGGISTILDGITVEDIDDETRQSQHIPADVHGAIISDIDSDSVGYREGLRQGFVIEEINRKPVKNADEAVALSKAVPKDTPVLLRVWSQGQSRYITLQAGK